MALELVIEPAFLLSDHLPEVCLFSGRTEGLRSVRLIAPKGAPPKTVVRVKAVPEVVTRQRWIHGLLPPIIGVTMIGLAVAVICLMVLAAPGAFIDSKGDLAMPGGCLFPVVGFGVMVLGSILMARLEARDAHVIAAGDGQHLKVVFPLRLEAVHAAWQAAYQGWVAAGRPPPNPKNSEEPEEDWADHHEGRWDKAGDG